MALVFTLCVLTTSRWTLAADKKYWDLSPYRVQLSLAVQCRAKPQAKLGDQLQDWIRKRIRATIYPLWSTEISLVEGPLKYQLLSGLEDLDGSVEVEAAARFDKQIFLSVRASSTGYVLESREYDCYLYRWGPVLRRNVRQQVVLAQQCFDLARATFAPLATIRPSPNDDRQVLLHFKGSDLPRQTSEEPFAEPGDIYQPFLVRTRSTGEVQPAGVKQVPWTLLTLDEASQTGWTSQVHTGIRTPFGLRRRGRVEHLAIATRHRPGTTPVRFHARHDATQALSGYEVFWREADDQETQLLGHTDANGTVQVAPGPNPVTTLFLRSDGQLLAKIPVAPGSPSILQVPVADDPARLRAQAHVTALREKLIDLVARRTILIARVRDSLQKGKIGEAQQRFNKLDNLPGRAQFDRQVSSAENNKLNRSADAKTQARIEKLFADIRKLLGRFLSAGEVSDLQKEMNAARLGSRES